MSLVRSGRLFALLLALVLASPSAALAQPSLKDKLESDRLFRQGKKLYGEGKYKEACDALAISDDLDPAIGTVGLLAACREKQGDLVAAWKGYLETKRRAEAKRDERATFAAEQAEALKARLAKLTITSRESESALEVTRDGESVPASMLGAPVPVNPGAHTITVRVAGAGEWTTSVSLKEGEARTVEIPALGDAGGGSGPPRWLAYVVGGVGLAGIGVGAAAGFVAMSNNEDSMDKKICAPTATQCPERDAAFTAATVSTVGFIAGGVGVAAGVVLFFVSSGGPSAGASGKAALGPVRVAPIIGRSGAGALVIGTF
jgi:hypothetical protein